MIKLIRALAWLALAALATSCTMYRVKDIDGQALAAKAAKAKIVGVQTALGSVAFSEDDPAAVRDGVVSGSVHRTYQLDPRDVADVSSGPAGPEVVLKDGTRFRVTASKSKGEWVECETVKPVFVPLEDVVKAKLKVKDAVGSIFGTLGAAVLVVGVAALEAAVSGDDEDLYDPEDSATVELIGSLLEPAHPPFAGRPNSAILTLRDSFDTSAEEEFWALEWAPVEARPGEDGKLRVKVDNGSGAPRGIDEAKLVIVDHPPGVTVAPDILGGVRSLAAPAGPETATDGVSGDILDFVSAKDGVFWRSRGELDLGAGNPLHDKIELSFPKPKGALKAKLIVSASNSAWRSEFAREVHAQADPGALTSYPEREYSKLSVRMMTRSGWQTGQVLFAGGPLPAVDMIYDLDLSDVAADKVQIVLSPPVGYWLIDRLAMDFGKTATVKAVEVAPDEVDGPDAAEVLKALAVEDGTTLRLAGPDDPATLTFTVPPPIEGWERSVFLRTVSCYEMRPAAIKK
jgi:hypothetical protein